MYPDTNLGTLDAPNVSAADCRWCATRASIPTRGGKSASLSGIILAATALVLLIACANVASLLLSRATTRGPEMAVRLALGANRVHLVRQLLTESLIVAIGGGALGVLFSLWTVGALPSFFPPEIAQLLDARVDTRVFAFTFAIALASGVVFGLVPALQTRRPNVIAGLRGESGGPQVARAGTRVRNAMVVVQVALSSVLVVSTGLLARSLANAWRADLGYGGPQRRRGHDRDSARRTGSRGHRSAISSRSRAEVRRLPGVEATGFVRDSAARPGRPARIPIRRLRARRRRRHGDQHQRRQRRRTSRRCACRSSRDESSTPATAIDGTRVIVVNDVLADRGITAGSAVGEQAIDSRDVEFEIVGVVRTGRYRNLQEAPLPIVYYPLSQEPEARMTLVARTSSDPGRHVETIAGAMRRVRSSVPGFQSMTLEEYMCEALATERLATALVEQLRRDGARARHGWRLRRDGVRGGVRRSREIGVRLALGARPLQIVRLVFAEGVRVTASVSRSASSPLRPARSARVFLHDMSGPDGLSLAAAPSILALVAAIAAIAPVRRALGVDPMIVLRQQ